jgi:hypothetical protein
MSDPDQDDRPFREGPDDVPTARNRLTRAYAELLAVVLASVAGVAMLLLWHLARRGRLIRDRLGSPRQVRWPERPDDGDRSEEP